ncbi:cyclodeaminase/cyclohydrolase family protein, partial [candidate division KSB1 bacterium]
NSITDVGVGAQIAFTGVKGGIYNVLINLKDIKDDKFNEHMRKQCTDLEKDARAKLDGIEKYIENKI